MKRSSIKKFKSDKNLGHNIFKQYNVLLNGNDFNLKIDPATKTMSNNKCQCLTYTFTTKTHIK